METTMTIGSTISKMEQADVTLRELYASLQLMRTGAAHGRQGRAVCRGCRISGVNVKCDGMVDFLQLI